MLLFHSRFGVQVGVLASFSLMIRIPDYGSTGPQTHGFSRREWPGYRLLSESVCLESPAPWPRFRELMLSSFHIFSGRRESPIDHATGKNLPEAVLRTHASIPFSTSCRHREKESLGHAGRLPFSVTSSWRVLRTTLWHVNCIYHSYQELFARLPGRFDTKQQSQTFFDVCAAALDLHPCMIVNQSPRKRRNQ